MNKTAALLRVQLLALFGINKMRHSRDPRAGRKFAGIAVLLAVGLLSLLPLLIAGNVAYGQIFADLGRPELLPAMMMAVASVVTLFPSMYKSGGTLFAGRDYDTLMALPVPTATVVASRVLFLYLLNLPFCLIVAVPSLIVYPFHASVSALYVPACILLTLALPLVPILIGSLLGALITAIASRFRRTAVVQIVLMLVLLLGVVAGSFVLPFFIEDGTVDLSAIGDLLAGSIYRAYFLSRLYTDALRGDWLSLGLFLLVSIGLFTAFSLLLGRFYKRICSGLQSTRARAQYVFTTDSVRASAPLVALYKREMKRYGASSLYVINTAVGELLALLLCGAVPIVGVATLEAALEAPGLAAMAGYALPFLTAMCLSITSTTTGTISLEGPSLWILQSLPVKAARIFAGKALVNLTLALPTCLVCAVLLWVALPVGFLQGVFILVIPCLYVLFTTLFGLIMNLRSPNFTWVSEAEAIKRGAPVIVTMLAGFLLTGLPFFGLFVLPASAHLAMTAAVATVMAALCAAAVFWLRRRGAETFRKL